MVCLLLRTQQKWQDHVLWPASVPSGGDARRGEENKPLILSPEAGLRGAGWAWLHLIGNGKPQVVCGSGRTECLKLETGSPSGGKRWWGLGEEDRRGRGQRERQGRVSHSKKNRKGQQTRRKKKKWGSSTNTKLAWVCAPRLCKNNVFCWTYLRSAVRGESSAFLPNVINYSVAF